MTRPLEGLRVIEFAALIAGPSCARMLADHGAEVIKVERYPNGDVSRGLNPADVERSPVYMQHNAGKKSVCINLKAPEGRQLALDLVATADVVIEANTPGVMDRLGLGYDDLKQVKPDIILCSISGFGQTGPNARRPGYAHMAHAMTGWLAMQFMHRNPPEEPRGPGIAIGDVIAGISAFGGVCAALVNRKATGKGAHIDIALFDSLFCVNDMSLQTYLTSGEVHVHYHPVYKTKDGYITVAIGPDFESWQRTCDAIGQSTLYEEGRFNSMAAVNANMGKVDQIIGEWASERRTAEIAQRFESHHIVFGIVQTVDQVFDLSQVKERSLTQFVDDPLLGSVEILGSPFCYSGERMNPRGPAPLLGQHNDQVLAEVAADGRNTIKALRRKKVIGDARG